LLAPPATAEAAGVRLDLPDGHLDLVGASPTGRRRWRANVGVVFQEPSASLNPLQTVDRQLRDVLGAQRRVSGAGTTVALDDEVERLLTAVGLPRPAEVRRLRPGQLSGGMAQRVMIALALAKNPALLVADEPTTALDVTVQAEIIRLLRRLCAERHFGVLLVTHDLGVAGELADRCLVMFRGQVIESAPTGEVVAHPWHPYTSALVSAVPQNEPGRPILTPPAAATGSDGPLGEAGCPYRRRCPYAIERCTTVVPGLEAVGATGDREPQLHRVACHRAAELDLEGAVAVAVVADGDEVAR
jgi:oligopeptide/dipeptide ABC transporter ATP-binding protein